jgi:hypothetical protein
MKTTQRPKPRRAHSVSWQPCNCGCGHFYIELLDPRGRAFAQAWLGRGDLLSVAECLVNVAETKPIEPRLAH